MPTYTVTKADKSQKGKDRVYFDGKTNWQDAYYIGQKCNGVPPIGSVIEADTSSTRFDGARQDTWFLNGWKLAQGAPQQIVQAPAFVPPQPAMILTTTKPSGWDIPTGDLSRFVSNVIGSVIAAGLIKQPSDMAPWIASAYRSCEGLRTGKILDFDDEPQNLSPLPEEDPADGHAGDGFDGDDEIPF